MDYQDTGLPPETRKAYEYFEKKIDEAAAALGFNVMRRENEVYFPFRLRRRAALIMHETGIAPDLISAFLLDSARLDKPRTEEEGDYIKREFGDAVHNHWQAISDPALVMSASAAAEEADACFTRMDRGPKSFKTARLAYYTATVETLLDQEDMILSGRKDPAPDRVYIDGCRTLTDHFSGASYALQRRLEKDFDRMDRILTRAGYPPQPEF